MAKKTATATRTIVRTIAAPAPIVRYRQAPKKKVHHRRGGGQSAQKVMMGMVVGGFALGFLDKSGTAIPTLPVLGRAGTIAVAAYFMGGKRGHGILADVAKAAAAVAAYEYGSKGSVSGDDGNIASQV